MVHVTVVLWNPTMSIPNKIQDSEECLQLNGPIDEPGFRTLFDGKYATLGFRLVYP